MSVEFCKGYMIYNFNSINICILLCKYYLTYILTYIYTYINNIWNYVIKTIPDHTLQLIYINTETNNLQYLIPCVYLLKYYPKAKTYHEIYYSITLWSSQKLAYQSIYIDSKLLENELENTNANINNYTCLLYTSDAADE